MTVPVSEIKALTNSIQSMNDKLENLNPGLVPVRTLLEEPAGPSRSEPPPVSVAAAPSLTHSSSPSNKVTPPYIPPR